MHGVYSYSPTQKKNHKKKHFIYMISGADIVNVTCGTTVRPNLELIRKMTICILKNCTKVEKMLDFYDNWLRDIKKQRSSIDMYKTYTSDI